MRMVCGGGATCVVAVWLVYGTTLMLVVRRYGGMLAGPAASKCRTHTQTHTHTQSRAGWCGVVRVRARATHTCARRARAVRRARTVTEGTMGGAACSMHPHRSAHTLPSMHMYRGSHIRVSHRGMHTRIARDGGSLSVCICQCMSCMALLVSIRIMIK